MEPNTADRLPTIVVDVSLAVFGALADFVVLDGVVPVAGFLFLFGTFKSFRFSDRRFSASVRCFLNRDLGVSPRHCLWVFESVVAFAIYETEELYRQLDWANTVRAIYKIIH